MSGEKNFNCSLIHQRLSAQVKKYRQKDPERIQKMPKIRRNFRSRGSSDLGVIEVAKRDEQQRGYARDDVHCVRPSEQIKKTARRVAGQVDTLNNQLAPHQDLSTEENQTESRSYRPPRAKGSSIRSC
jgi:hypothetical protein